jgi:Glycosyl transferase family 90
MPGVLLHHETPSQDWYFDQMVPWIHYIPIRTDVSDLEERYHWAEEHPSETEQIARAGTQFAHHMFSKRTIRQELESYFGETSTMGPILDGYQATDNETLESILATYATQKIYLTEVATCDRTSCEVKIQPTFQYQFSLTNRSDCNVIRCPY